MLAMPDVTGACEVRRKSSNSSAGLIVPRSMTGSVSVRSSAASDDVEVVAPTSSVGGVFSSSAGVLSRVLSLKSSGSAFSKKSSRLLQTATTAASLVAPTILEASLVHGITAQTLLSKGARAFRNQEFDNESHYSMSFETETLGDFISHDWGSSRLSKLMALGLVYNSGAALIASAVVSVGVTLLQYGPDPILPPPNFPELADEILEGDASALRARHYGFWNTVLAPIVFLIFFLFWQDMQSFLRLKTRTCFLDKYCIDQGDPKRKAAGILGLAGFLRCSDRMIILWSPRYFTRLWCTYEVASWLYLKKPLTSVHFLPLEHTTIITAMWLLSVTLFMCLDVMTHVFPTYYTLILSTGVLGGLFTVTHQLRRAAMHLRAIKDQLLMFAVTNSSCFCCTEDHITATGERIPCDREVVYATIAEWFNDPNDSASVSQAARLDRFDWTVRKYFAAQVLQKAGPTHMHYRYLIVLGWPFFMRGCDILLAAQTYGQNYFWNILLYYLMATFVIYPGMLRSAMVLCCWTDRRIGRPRSCVLDVLVSVALVIFILSCLLVGHLSHDYVLRTNMSPLSTLSFFIVAGSVNCWMYYPPQGTPCRRWRNFAAPSDSKPREDHVGRESRGLEGGDLEGGDLEKREREQEEGVEEKEKKKEKEKEEEEKEEKEKQKEVEPPVESDYFTI